MIAEAHKKTIVNQRAVWLQFREHHVRPSFSAAYVISICEWDIVTFFLFLACGVIGTWNRRHVRLETTISLGVRGACSQVAYTAYRSSQAISQSFFRIVWIVVTMATLTPLLWCLQWCTRLQSAAWRSPRQYCSRGSLRYWILRSHTTRSADYRLEWCPGGVNSIVTGVDWFHTRWPL